MRLSTTAKQAWSVTPRLGAKVRKAKKRVQSASKAIEMSFKGQPLREGHRVAWALHYGEDPGSTQIDHIDGNKPRLITSV